MAVNKKMHGYFLIVAEEIGCHWTTLGRRLNVPNSTIENIEHELGKSLEDRAYHVLERWYQKNGQAGATREVLGKALEAIGQKSIAEKIGYHGSHGMCVYIWLILPQVMLYCCHQQQQI